MALPDGVDGQGLAGRHQENIKIRMLWYNGQDLARRIVMDALSLENLIVLRTDIHNGRPTIGGTGVTVRTVVGHYKLGLTAEEISDEMGLDLAGVYAALAYYHLNRDVIEADISANSEEVVSNELNRG
jgi:uncharacterized protein (DUF433 family)